MIKRSLGERVFNVVNIILLIILSLVTLYPFLYVVFASFSNPLEFIKHDGALLSPTGFSLAAYQKVFEKSEIWIGYGNTIFYVVAGTLISMILTITLGYGLSKKDLKFSKPIMLMVFITMYFGGGLLPTYMVVRNLDLLDTRWAILLPTAINTFNLIIMKTAFQGVPESVEEAAIIDGASGIRLLVSIVLPLVKPTIAVLVLYYASSMWNSWFQAAIYLRDNTLYPLQMYLRDILITNEQTDMMQGTDSAERQALSSVIKYATIMVSIVPMLFVYPFLQKYFAKGVMVGAVKG
ncbi:MAG: carbohydrate ABC transporter permease [Ruminococcaceae bacterium]|nr:carbohydrate ABC transporter permease [Oscillospiraceae bacterium]